MEEDTPVADGVLVNLSLWGTSIIGLAVQRPDGKYFGSITAPEPVYDHVLEFLSATMDGHSANSWMLRLTSRT